MHAGKAQTGCTQGEGKRNGLGREGVGREDVGMERNRREGREGRLGRGIDLAKETEKRREERREGGREGPTKCRASTLSSLLCL